MGPNQIKAFLIQTSPTFITSANCKVAPLSFQRNKKFCSCFIRACSKVLNVSADLRGFCHSSMQDADVRPPTPATEDDPFLALGNGGTEGRRRQCGWQQPSRPPGTIPPQPAQLAPIGFSSRPADPLHHKDHGFSFLLQGAFLIFYLQPGPTQIQGNSKAPCSHTAHSFLAFKRAVRFWFGIDSLLEATQEWREHSKRYPPSRISSPMWHFCSILKAESGEFHVPKARASMYLLA